jgi:hypothetical protein
MSAYLYLELVPYVYPSLRICDELYDCLANFTHRICVAFMKLFVIHLFIENYVLLIFVLQHHSPSSFN